MATEDRHPAVRRYTLGAIALHWAIAILILVQIPLGYWMVEIAARGSAAQYDAYQIHKSFGILVLVLSVGRVLWRLFNPPPSMPYDMPGWERLSAKAVHVLFYALIFLIPLSGWLLVSTSRIEVQTVLFFMPQLPWPHIPVPDGARHTVHAVSEVAHVWLSYGAAALVVLHVGAALKHQWKGENVIGRMLPEMMGRIAEARRSYGYAATLSVMVLAAAAAIGWGTLQTRAAGETTTLALASDRETATDAAPAAGGRADTTTTTAAADDAAAGGGTADAGAGSTPGAPSADGSAETGDAARASGGDAASDNAGGGGNGTTTAGDSGGTGVAPDPVTDTSGGVAEAAPEVGGDEGAAPAAAGTEADGTVGPAAPATAAEADPTRAETPDGAPLVVRPEGAGTAEPNEAAPAADTLPAPDMPREPVMESWQVDPARSSLTFTFAFAGREVTGTIADWSADIVFDPESLGTSSISVLMKMNSASVSGGDITEAQLKGGDGFDTAAFGAAEFSSTDIRQTGEGSYVADGTLTIRGVSNPLSLPFTLTMADGVGTAESTAEVERLAYDIGRSNDPSGDNLPLKIAVSARVTAKAPAAIAER